MIWTSITSVLPPKNCDQIEYVGFYNVITNLMVVIGSSRIQRCDEYCEVTAIVF